MATQAAGDIFVTDGFTNSSGTELHAHDADWVDALEPLFGAGLAGQLVISDANRARPTAGLFGVLAQYYNSTTPPSAEYDVRADLRVVSEETNSSFNIFGRVTADTSASVGAGYNNSTGEWVLTDGTSSDTFAQALSNSTTYAVELRIRDDEAELYIDSVLRCSIGAPVPTAAEFVGIALASDTAGNSVGYHVDNFVAQDVTGGAAPALPPMDIIWIG